MSTESKIEATFLKARDMDLKAGLCELAETMGQSKVISKLLKDAARKGKAFASLGAQFGACLNLQHYMKTKHLKSEAGFQIALNYLFYCIEGTMALRLE